MVLHASMREAFDAWLINENIKEYSSEAVIACMDKVSEYALAKKILRCSLWDVKTYDLFKSIYKKLRETMLLRISDKNMYSTFLVAGQLYLKFLKEKPLVRKNTTVKERIDVQANDFITPLTYPHSSEVKHILLTHFSNGYLLSSPIEMTRFRSFVVKDFGEELTFSDDELKKYIVACGTTYEGKVYVVPAEIKEKIKTFADNYFANGAQAIFYAEFYAKNESWLFDGNIVSEDMLKDILRQLFPHLLFTQTYFGNTNDTVFSTLENEILRVWGDETLHTYDELAKQLIYVPTYRIAQTLSQGHNFIWSSKETFSHIRYIDITNKEQEIIRDVATHKCNDHGYASVTDLPCTEIKERNHELSTTAIHNAVYLICLSDKFDKKGKIIIRKGDNLDVLTIIEEYCRTIDKCSLGDLLNLERELTGEVHRWAPMGAGNAILVRIDKDTYVADKYINFDTNMTDKAIELFVGGEYLPLQSFTTFGAFPNCGHVWNLFLLESYCRRFSQKFRFDVPAVNSRNAGVVIRKSCDMSYVDIMADAITKSNIQLEKLAIGRFLYEKGYTGKSTTSKIEEIISKARS
ncbi:MAG: hypothetical protein LBV04_05455, partial [Deferribacteraceae bacterium]|nr:hypothetical protein [Deferribacteraceae bacterium]